MCPYRAIKYRIRENQQILSLALKSTSARRLYIVRKNDNRKLQHNFKPLSPRTSQGIVHRILEHFFYSDKLPKAQHLLRLHGIQVRQHTWSGIILFLTLGLTSFRCTSALEDMPVCDVAHVNDLDRCEADVAEVMDEVVRAQCGYGCGSGNVFAYGRWHNQAELEGLNSNVTRIWFKWLTGGDFEQWSLTKLQKTSSDLIFAVKYLPSLFFGNSSLSAVPQSVEVRVSKKKEK